MSKREKKGEEGGRNRALVKAQVLEHGMTQIQPINNFVTADFTAIQCKKFKMQLKFKMGKRVWEEPQGSVGGCGGETLAPQKAADHAVRERPGKAYTASLGHGGTADKETR